MCEISLACDNLLCDGHGRPPTPVLEIDVQSKSSKTWIKYARTEVVEVTGKFSKISPFKVVQKFYKSFSLCLFQQSSNPNFLTTVSFRASDGLTTETKIRITAYDVRERVSQTATPIGSAIVTFSTVQDTPR